MKETPIHWMGFLLALQGDRALCERAKDFLHNDSSLDGNHWPGLQKASPVLLQRRACRLTVARASKGWAARLREPHLSDLDLHSRASDQATGWQTRVSG